jgi:hypothetical protein
MIALGRLLFSSCDAKVDKSVMSAAPDLSGSANARGVEINYRLLLLRADPRVARIPTIGPAGRRYSLLVPGLRTFQLITRYLS